MLREALLRHVRNRQQHGASDYWHPSKVGQCDRRAVLNRAGVAGKPPDDATLIKFWIGDVIHEAIQKILSDDPEVGVLGHELTVKDEEHHVSGRLDTLTSTDLLGIEVAEWKTIDSNAFRYAELPYESAIHQSNIYLTFPADCPLEHPNPLCLPTAHKLPLPERARIGYIGKTEGRVEEFTVEGTDELRANVKANLLRLEDLLTNYKASGALPEALCIPATDYRIRFCEYKGTGLCCGDPANDTQGTTPGGTDQAPDEPPGLPGLLQLGPVPQHKERGRQGRKRKVRAPKEGGLAQGTEQVA